MKTLNEIKELPNLMILHVAVDGGFGVLFKAEQKLDKKNSKMLNV